MNLIEADGRGLMHGANNIKMEQTQAVCVKYPAPSRTASFGETMESSSQPHFLMGQRAKRQTASRARPRERSRRLQLRSSRVSVLYSIETANDRKSSQLAASLSRSKNRCNPLFIRGGEARNRTKPAKDHLATTVLKTADNPV